jgi:hypothetical protein
MENQDINYVISSDDKTNTGIGNFYDIDFGGLNTGFEDFIVTVKQIVLNGNVLSSNGYILLTAENLATGNDVFSPVKLGANECIIGVISTNIDGLMSNSGISFRVNNIRIRKQIRFRLLTPDFNSAVSGTDINIAGIETKWVIQLSLKGVKDRSEY